MRRSVGFLSVLFLLLLARVLPAQSEAEAAFLGLAVATSIGEDQDGLTVLEGVHHAVWSDTLPVTEDLQIYTRWRGTGTHTIGVSVWSSDTGDTLAETSEDLDFGSDPVTYYTHDFTGTSFPDPGIYVVEVTLDGDAAANYEFYVNVDDQFPEDPEYVLSVPAESGSVDDAGDASVSGIFEYFAFSSFPATDSFAIVTLWFSGDADYDHYVQIRDPEGQPIATSKTQTLSAYYGEMSEITDSFNGITFPSAGTYTAAVYLDGEEMFSYPLEITKE